MTYTKAVATDVLPGTSTSVHIQIDARVVRLDVRDLAGRPVVGFDLGASIEGRSAGMLHNWDLLARASSRLSRGDGEPLLYLPSVVEVTLVVNKFGVGYFQGTPEPAGQASSSRVLLILDQEARDYREAWRSH